VKSRTPNIRPDAPNILLINPWIHDFAAYDFWAKPVGLLYLASILKKHGFAVSYIDCLDRFHPQRPKTDPYTRYGRGPYLKTKIRKPAVLSDITRNYSRYGIRKEWFFKQLHSIPKPDLILITSLMTYWYPGLQETIRETKKTYPDVPIILGGIYATLCKQHAVEHSGADLVVTGSDENNILKLAQDYTGYSTKSGLDSIRFDPDNLDTWPYPAFELQNRVGYVCLLTSTGCPFACAYCASSFLNPKRRLRSPELVVEEIEYWHKKYNVIDFVFYDDALLVDSEQHAVPILEGIVDQGLNIRFHTPNALHIREISNRLARLMFKAGFKTLRLGLETAALEKRKDLDRKVIAEEFRQAADNLLKAGFHKDQIGIYLLAGMPGQSLKEVEASIKVVLQHNTTPVVAYYSPIPHTALWEKAKTFSRYDLETDPVFTNNAILPCQSGPFSWKTITHLKNRAADHS